MESSREGWLVVMSSKNIAEKENNVKNSLTTDNEDEEEELQHSLSLSPLMFLYSFMEESVRERD